MLELRQTPETSNIPDSRGINFFLSDPSFGALLKSYLGETVFHGVHDRLVALGQRASDELDAWATTADHHPPMLRPRTRRHRSSSTRSRSCSSRPNSASAARSA